MSYRNNNNNKYTLYTPQASFRAFPVLIAAEYNGVNVEIVTESTATNTAAAQLSPIGKLPLLQCPDGSVIFSSHAAARYVGGLRTDTGLVSVVVDSNSQQQQQQQCSRAQIDAWMDWCATDLELPVTVWFYPVVGYMPFHPASYEKSKTDLAKGLSTLEAHLEGKTFLVSNQHVTLADIVVVSTLLYPFKLVCDPDYLQPYPRVVEWFQKCVTQPEFQQILGTVTLCQEELKATEQS